MIILVFFVLFLLFPQISSQSEMKLAAVCSVPHRSALLYSHSDTIRTCRIWHIWLLTKWPWLSHRPSVLSCFLCTSRQISAAFVLIPRVCAASLSTPKEPKWTAQSLFAFASALHFVHNIQYFFLWYGAFGISATDSWRRDGSHWTAMLTDTLTHAHKRSPRCSQSKCLF